MWWNRKAISELAETLREAGRTPNTYVPPEGGRFVVEGQPRPETAADGLRVEIEDLVRTAEGPLPQTVLQVLGHLRPGRAAPPPSFPAADPGTPGEQLGALCQSAAEYLDKLAMVVARLPQTEEGPAGIQRKPQKAEKLKNPDRNPAYVSAAGLPQLLKSHSTLLSELAAVDASAFAPPWPAETFLDLLSIPGWQPGLILIRDRADRVIGFALTAAIVTDSHTTVAILRLAGRSPEVTQFLLEQLKYVYTDRADTFIAMEEYESRSVIDQYQAAGFRIDQEKSHNTDHIHLVQHRTALKITHPTA